MSDSSDSENPPPRSTAAIDEQDRDAGSSRSLSSDSSSSSDNNQESSSNSDGVMVNRENIGGGDSDEVVVSEDAGRDDMFLDASEDLGADGRESMAFTEPRGGSDSEHAEQHEQFRGLHNQMQNDYMVDEMDRLRYMLDKAVMDKESAAQEFKDELERGAKAIADLRDRMRGFVSHGHLDDGTSGGLAGTFDEKGIGNVEEKGISSSDASLHEMLHECTVYLQSVIDSHLLKDQEIENLNAHVAEISVSREVLDVYMNSMQNVYTEAQLQKDQYVGEVANRILSSLAPVVYVDGLLDDSVTAKVAHAEKSVYALIENYNWFLYETDQLRQHVVEVRPDLAEQSDYGAIYVAAQNELLEFRRKEVESAEMLRHLEDENRELLEQIEKQKAVVEMAQMELERTRAELDQERTRYSNTKEKLSLAVTKGKGLVQQRDTLKQALADKTGELDRCLVTLQEKSIALEAAESMKEELVKTQISAASLQEILSRKNLLFEKLEEIMSECDVPDGLNPGDVTERTRWLVDERKSLMDVSQKFHNLANVLLSIDLPENFPLSDLDSRVIWLKESYDQAKAEVSDLQDEIARTREAVSNEMDQLTAALSTALLEKDYLKVELDDMTERFEKIVGKEHQVSSEKEQMLRMLTDASGVSEEGISWYSSDSILLVEECIGKIKVQSMFALQSSQEKAEILESMQTLLYIKDQELALYKGLLEEELMEKSEWNKLSNDLKKASEEVDMLRGEKDSLKKDLERVEEKSALLREKLSLAVKKGKGLVQDRENLKQLIDEKSTEIEKLKLELRQQELAIIDCRNENNRLSAELLKLEANLVELNDQRDLLEKGLMESNRLLEKVMESITNTCSFFLPSGSEPNDPFERVKWLEAHFSETQVEKENLEKELKKERADVESLAKKLAEAHSTITSTEEALWFAQNRISQLIGEKKDLELYKVSIEEQLQGALQESQAKDNMLAEAVAAKASIENALSAAETNMLLLITEKEEALSSRTAAEAELIKVKEEVALLTSNLAEASTNIKSLEDAVYHLQIRVSSLSEENDTAHIRGSEVEKGLNMLKEEANDRERKLQDAFATIKSMEDALRKAESSASSLTVEIKAVEQDKITLTTKLNACMEELAGTHGSLQTRSLELFDGYFKNLELLVKDETIFSSLRQSCVEKLESLREMDLLFKSIRNQFAEISLDEHPAVEEVSYTEKYLSVDHVNNIIAEYNSSHVDTTEADDIYLRARKIEESLGVRHRTYAEKLDNLSSFLNQYNAAVLQELRAIRDHVKSTVEHVYSLKEEVKLLETDKRDLENTKAILEDGISVLLSACTDVTHELQLEAKKHEGELGSGSEQVGQAGQETQSYNYVETAQNLFSASKKAATVFGQFEKSEKALTSTIKELHNVVNETKVAADEAIGQRDLYQNKVLNLEADFEALQSLCSQLRHKLEEYKGIEAHLNSREVEFSSLQGTLSMKELEAEEALHWVSKVKNLLDEVDGIEITSVKPQIENFVPQDSPHIKKLMYITANFTKLQHQITSLSRDKEELQATLATQLQEIKHLRQLVEDSSSSSEQEIVKIRSELYDLVEGLEKIIEKLGGSNITGNKNYVATSKLLEALEKLVMALIAESEDSKSRIHELDSQLSGSQKYVEELLSKVKVLEDSLETRDAPVEMLQERNYISNDQELRKVKSELLDLVGGLERIFHRLGGKDYRGDQKSVAPNELVEVLEKQVTTMIVENNHSKSKADELDLKLLASQKAVDELLSKVKVLEDSLRARAAPAEIIQERSIFEAPSLPSASELSEVEDVGPLAKPGISPVPSAAHARAMRKGSSDHIALDVESGPLITHDDTDKDKGHVFKALNTSGLIPVQGKMIADRIDGIWVSGARVLMSRPRARLGLIAYWLSLHIWLLATIL
ncbi:hypothetical protein Dimus_031911 [Dionaea muscipula]